MDKPSQHIYHCDSNISAIKQETRKSYAILEDRIIDLEHDLAQVRKNIKNKERLIKLQGDQLKKMEEMQKRTLDDNKSLNIEKRKAQHDLENLRIIIKEHERKRKNVRSIGCATEIETNVDVEKLDTKTIESMLHQHRAILNAIFAICVFSSHLQTRNNIDQIKNEIATLKESLERSRELAPSELSISDDSQVSTKYTKNINKENGSPQLGFVDDTEGVTNENLEDQNTDVGSGVQSFIDLEHMSILEEENQILKLSVEKLKNSCRDSEDRLRTVEINCTKFETEADLNQKLNEHLQEELMQLKAQLSRLIGNLEHEITLAKEYYIEDLEAGKSSTSNDLKTDEKNQLSEYRTQLNEDKCVCNIWEAKISELISSNAIVVEVEALRSTELTNTEIKSTCLEVIRDLMLMFDNNDSPIVGDDYVPQQIKQIWELIRTAYQAQLKINADLIGEIESLKIQFDCKCQYTSANRAAESYPGGENREGSADHLEVEELDTSCKQFHLDDDAVAYKVYNPDDTKLNTQDLQDVNFKATTCYNNLQDAEVACEAYNPEETKLNHQVLQDVNFKATTCYNYLQELLLENENMREEIKALKDLQMDYNDGNVKKNVSNFQETQPRVSNANISYQELLLQNSELRKEVRELKQLINFNSDLTDQEETSGNDKAIRGEVRGMKATKDVMSQSTEISYRELQIQNSELKNEVRELKQLLNFSSNLKRETETSSHYGTFAEEEDGRKATKDVKNQSTDISFQELLLQNGELRNEVRELNQLINFNSYLTDQEETISNDKTFPKKIKGKKAIKEVNNQSTDMEIVTSENDLDLYEEQFTDDNRKIPYEDLQVRNNTLTEELNQFKNLLDNIASEINNLLYTHNRNSLNEPNKDTDVILGLSATKSTTREQEINSSNSLEKPNKDTDVMLALSVLKSIIKQLESSRINERQELDEELMLVKEICIKGYTDIITTVRNEKTPRKIDVPELHELKDGLAQVFLELKNEIIASKKRDHQQYQELQDLIDNHRYANDNIIEALKHKLEDSRNEIELSSLMITELQEQIERLKISSSGFQQMLQDYKNDNTHTSKMCSDLQAHILDLELELSDAKKREEIQTKIIEELQAHILDLEHELIDAKKGEEIQNKIIEELKEELECCTGADIECCAGAEIECCTGVEMYKEDDCLKDETIECLRTKLEDHQNTIDNLQAQLLRASTLQTTICELSAEIKDYRKKVKVMEENHSELECSRLECESLREQVRELSPLQTMICELGAEIEDYRKKMHVMEENYSDMECSKLECESLREQVRELSGLQTTICELSAEIKDYRNKMHAMEENYSELECSRMECESLREQVMELKENIFVVTSLRNKYYELMEKYEQQNAELIKQNTFMKDNIGVIGEYKSKLAKNELLVARLQKEIADVKKLNSELPALKENYSKLKLEKQRMQRDFDNYVKMQSNLSKGDVQRIMGECEKYKSNLDCLNARICKYIEEQSRYEEEAEGLRKILFDENKALKSMLKQRCVEFPRSSSRVQRVTSLTTFDRSRERQQEGNKFCCNCSNGNIESTSSYVGSLYRKDIEVPESVPVNTTIVFNTMPWEDVS